jgi:hypothetical protein
MEQFFEVMGTGFISLQVLNNKTVKAGDEFFCDYNCGGSSPWFHVLTSDGSQLPLNPSKAPHHFLPFPQCEDQCLGHCTLSYFDICCPAEPPGGAKETSNITHDLASESNEQTSTNEDPGQGVECLVLFRLAFLYLFFGVYPQICFSSQRQMKKRWFMKRVVIVGLIQMDRIGMLLLLLLLSQGGGGATKSTSPYIGISISS